MLSTFTTKIRDRIAQFRTWFTSLSLFKQMLAWLFFIVVVMGFVSLAIGQGFWGEKGRDGAVVRPGDTVMPKQGASCTPTGPDGIEHCCECHPKYCGIGGK